MVEAKPLDLGFEEVMKDFFMRYKGFDEESWSKFWKVYKQSPIMKDFNIIFEMINQKIRKACLFYLRYKSHPYLLLEELEYVIEDQNNYAKLKPKVKEWADKIEDLPPNEAYEELLQYDEWLFKTTFKDIIKPSQ